MYLHRRRFSSCLTCVENGIFADLRALGRMLHQQRIHEVGKRVCDLIRRHSTWLLLITAPVLPCLYCSFYQLFWFMVGHDALTEDAPEA